MKIIKKQLAILGAFLAVNVASNAMFDLEFKMALEPYTFANETFKADDKEIDFRSIYPMNQKFQNFGIVAQGQYNVLDRLYTGLSIGLHYDMSFTGLIKVNVETKLKSQNEAAKTVQVEQNLNHKGGFFNIPILALVKYDIPINSIDYPINAYTILKFGLNVCISNENNKESQSFTGKPGLSYGIGGGLELYGFQLELLFNGLVNTFAAKSPKEDAVKKLTLDRLENTESINKSYSRMGFNASIGYRLPIL